MKQTRLPDTRIAHDSDDLAPDCARSRDGPGSGSTFVSSRKIRNADGSKDGVGAALVIRCYMKA